MARCLVDSQTLLFDNDGIRRYSRRLESAISHQLTVGRTARAPQAFA